ncbi:MAG TPA: thioredoxin-dependent thiol peroxidase [Williamwhitmania sp.]|nr:thioredoxin-dependent thiol peroxidase [Williamwhitmania sp.]
MSMLKPGDKAPEFSGKDQNGAPISLLDYKGKKLILYFYPKDNTPGCTAEACSLRDGYEELTKLGFDVVGVSADSEKSHQEFIGKFNLPFRLISDTSQEIIKAYGAWGEKKMYGKSYEGILRTTFVVGADGRIEKVFDKVKTADHVSQILSEMA